MGLILLILAKVLHLIFKIATFWYKPVYYIQRFGFKKGMSELDRHYKHQALAEDQAGNVSLWMVLNKVFTKGKDRYFFGDEDDSISYVSAMNYYKNLDEPPTRGLNKLLRFLDKDHDIKSIKNKIARDLEGAARLKAAGFIGTSRNRELNPDKHWMKYPEHVNNNERLIKL